MITTSEGPRALNGDQVERLFDHAEEAEVAGGVAADAAALLVGDVTADGAGSGVRPHGADRPGQGERLGLGGAQQVEGESLGGAGADPWESGEGLNEALDLVAIERTGAFRGRYHVLNGALSPMSGIGPGQLRMKELFERVDAAAAEGNPVREVIIATNPSPEGDVTLLYLQERLGTKVPSITSMARGLPFGADLQYADAVTILRSLEERRGVE